MSCTLTSRTRSLTHALTHASKLARRSKHARMGGRAHLRLGQRPRVGQRPGQRLLLDPYHDPLGDGPHPASGTVRSLL